MCPCNRHMLTAGRYILIYASGQEFTNDICRTKIYPCIFIYLFAAIGLLPGGSGYFTCKQNTKLVTTRFKSGRLHEKHVVATWNVGNHLSICL